MKKLILIIISILMLFTTSIIQTLASVEAPPSHKPTLEDVKAIYSDIFYNYQYAKLGELHINKNKPFIDRPIKDLFTYDVNFIKEHKKGGAIQLTRLLIERLTNNGIKAVQAIALKEINGNDLHHFVVYELDGQKYVADPVLEKVYSTGFIIEGELNCGNIPLDEYFNIINDEYKCVMIFRELPQNINKSFVELVPGVDFDIVELSKF